MKAKKSLGQNFLMHARIAERMVLSSGAGPKDTVLEIGPGTGMLTRVLLARVRRVIAVEADRDLVSKLEEVFASDIASGKLTLTHGDIRSFDEECIDEPYQLIANIPYYLTGEIFRKFLSARKKPAHMTLLVQKEVAERIARAKKESILSLSVKAYGVPRYEFTVPRGAFIPKPNVDSAVLSIKNIQINAFPSKKAEQRFFELLHAGFAHKRKRLARNLEVLALPYVVLEAMRAAQIPPQARAEDISLPQWRTLAAAL